MKRSLKKIGSRIGKVRTLLKKYFCATINLVKKVPKFLAKDFLGMPRYVWALIFLGGAFVLPGLFCRNGDLNGFIAVGLAIGGGGFLIWRSKLFERRMESTEQQIGFTEEQIKIANRQAETQRKTGASQSWRNALELMRGDSDKTVMWGIVYLSKIAEGNLDDYGKITMNVFRTFIRDEVGKIKRPDNSKKEDSEQIDLPEKIKVLFERAVSLKNKMEKNTSFRQYVIHEIFDLSNLDFSGINFPGGFDMSGANLESTNFRQSALNSVNFTDADLGFANFSKTSLMSANFTGARFMKNCFDRNKLLASNFTGASIKLVSFEGASMRHARFNKADMYGVKWINLDIRQSQFENIKFARWATSGGGIEFVGCDLTGSNFKNINLMEAHFENCNLTDISLDGCDFKDYFENLLNGKTLGNRGKEIVEERKKEIFSSSFFTYSPYGYRERKKEGKIPEFKLPSTLKGVEKPKFLSPEDIVEKGLPIDEIDYSFPSKKLRPTPPPS